MLLISNCQNELRTVTFDG